MRVLITETAIKAAVKRAAEADARQELADKDTTGLRLRVTPGGTKTWLWGGRDQDGRPRRFVLGQHDAMGVSEAREAARVMRQNVQRAGADPVAAAKQRRAAARDAAKGINTLSALLDLYGGPKPPKKGEQAAPEDTASVGEKPKPGPGAKLKSWPECRRRIEHVFAEYLGKPLTQLRAEALLMTADMHDSEKSAAAAVRYLRPVLKWAAAKKYVAAGVADLHKRVTLVRRDRVLDREELERLLPVLSGSESAYARAMRFMLWTLARREEVGRATWGSVDLEGKTWTIATTKNGQPHVVPLPRQAVAFLASIKPTKAGAEALIFANRNGGPLANWDRAAKAIMAESTTEGWTRHDLRRTGTTMLGDMGETPDILEAALNHVAIRSPLAATYNRSRYRPQVAAALQRLADALEDISKAAPQRSR